MKKLKTDRDVRNPIIMTNILRKNPKYHKCYELYRFIERYQQLGVSYKVDERVSLLNEEEVDQLNTVMFTNYLAIQDVEHSKKIKETSRTYKPKILTSIDDEQFVYGDLLKGPFNFVRIDDEYQAYLDSKIKKDLPVHPTKVEKEYYSTEYAKKKERKEDKVQIEKLKKRKSKEALENEKRIKKIIAEREREEELRRQQEEEARRLEEERRLDEIRKEIIAAARGDMPEEAEEVPNEEAITDEVLAEEPVEEAASSESESDSETSNEPIEYDFHIVIDNDAPFEDIYDDSRDNESIESYISNSKVSKEDVESIEEDYDLFERVEESTKKEDKPKRKLLTIKDFGDIKPRKESDYEDIYADDDESDSNIEQYIMSADIGTISASDIEELLSDAKAPKKKAKKTKNKEKKEEPKKAPIEEVITDEVLAEEPQEAEIIPGRFIVKTPNGYYVSEGNYSIHKRDAYIFDDFNKANEIKKRLGGKVVKL